MSGYSDLSKLENSRRNCLRRIARHDEPQFSKDSIVNVMEKFVKTVNAMDETILVPCRLMDRQVGDSTDIIPTPGKDSTANQLTLNSQSKRNSSQSKHVHEFLNASELFNLYSMLNSLKNDLLWTGKDKVIDEEDTKNVIYPETNIILEEGDNNVNNNATTAMQRTDSVIIKNETTSNETIATMNAPNETSTTTTTITKGHVRRPSNTSVASIVSVSNLSDCESDSGMESDNNKCENQSGSSAESMSSSSSENEVRAQKAANVDKATELAQRCRRHLNGLYQCLEQMTEAANYLTARYQSDIGGPA